MGVDTNNVVVYGYKLPYIILPDSDENKALCSNHNPKYEREGIDPEKIYMLSDNYCGEYTVVGYVIEYCESGEGFHGFIDLDVQRDDEPIIKFLWQDCFEDLIPEDMGVPELFVFTHHT